MPRSFRRLAAALAVAALLFPAAAGAQGFTGTKVEGSNASPAFDMIILRPVGFAGLVASAVLWIPAQAMTMITRPSEWEKPIDLMLKKPAAYVFTDPIGSH